MLKDSEAVGEEEENQAAMSAHVHRNLKDWREDKINPCTAYFTKRLRHNDYLLVNNYLMAHIAVALLTVCVCIAGDGSLGFPWGAAFLHFMWIIMAVTGSLETSRKMFCGERLLLIMAYVIVYVCGALYLRLHWDFSGKQGTFLAELEDKNDHMKDATYFAVGYIVFMPFLTSSICAYLKVKDDLQSK